MMPYIQSNLDSQLEALKCKSCFFKFLGYLTVFWGPYNKDPTIRVLDLGSPIFGNYHMVNLNSPGLFLNPKEPKP